MKRITKFFTASIQRKILFSFALVIILVIGMIVGGYYQLSQVTLAAEEVIPASSQMGALQAFALALSSLEANLERLFVIGGFESEEAILADLAGLAAASDSMAANATAESKPQVDTLQEAAQDLAIQINGMVEAKNTTKLSSRELNEEIISVYAKITAIKALYETLTTTTLNQLQTNAIAQAGISSNVMIQFLVLGTLVVLIVVGASVVVTRSIAVPLSSLAETATRIAEGDLEAQAPVITQDDEVGQLAVAFNTMTAQIRELIGSLEKRVADRTQRLRLVAAMSEELSASFRLDELLPQVVRSLQENFGYYHAQIYLMDEAHHTLVLTSATGEAGQTMLAQHHTIPVGKGLVGRAAAKNSIILAPNLARMIAPEMITPQTVDHVYRRQTNLAYQAEWYRNYINHTFTNLDTLAASAGHKLQLGYLLHFKGDFTDEIRRGAETAARDLNVDIEIVAPDNSANRNELLSLYDQMLKTKKDGLVVVPNFDTYWPARFNQANQLGIPVVTANLTSPSLSNWPWFGQDGYQAGFMLAQKFKTILAEHHLLSGKIVVGFGGIHEPELIARYEGFKKALERTDYTLTDPQETSLEAKPNFNAWNDLAEAHPDMIAAIGLTVLDVPSLARIKQRDNAAWLIAGFDLDMRTLDGLKTNLVQLTIGQHPYLQGYLPILALVQYLRENQPLQNWVVEGWLPNPLLPDTKAEISLPIALEGRVVGVLDVQADHVGGLNESDVNLLRSLANQVAAAIHNSRQFSEVQTALAEAKAIQQRYLEQSWDRNNPALQNSYFHYSQPDAPLLPPTRLTEIKHEIQVQGLPALLPFDETATRHATHPAQPPEQILAAPVTLRDTMIGALQLYSAQADQPWGEDDLAIVAAVADQLAQTAENLRLFEQTRQRAGREQTLREITEKIRTAANLEQLVKITAEELSRRFEAEYALIDLGIESPAEPITRPESNSNGHK
jgi:ABC-type sugar transport system substrate-binding protein/HAMP domain-containing protein